jgi:two-component system LytT family response regulator
MVRKLKCVLVDDDEMSLIALQHLFKNIPYVEVIQAYTSPEEFLEVIKELDFDVCLLDIDMPESDSIEVAKRIKDKPLIFIAETSNKLLDAAKLSPIAVITKPFDQGQLNIALRRLYQFIDRKPVKEFQLFTVAETKGKIKLRPKDFYYAGTDYTDSRHKQVITRDGKIYTLMNIKFDRLLSLLGNSLVKANKAEMVSLEAVHKIESDEITLDIMDENGKAKMVTIGRSFKKNFISAII